MNAGDLWEGAHIRQADGAYGVVQALHIEHEPQVMYNLTVAEAHTFFVGEGQWLVHNGGSRCTVTYQKLAGLLNDVLQKGYHVDIRGADKLKELSLRPRKLANGQIEITVKGAQASDRGPITNDVLKGTRDLLQKKPKKGIEGEQGIIDIFASDPSYEEVVDEARLLLEAFTDGNYKLVKPE